MQKERTEMQDCRASIIQRLGTDINADLKASKEIDQYFESLHNPEEITKFFLNSKMGYQVRKMPESELHSVDIQDECQNEQAGRNATQTPRKALNARSTLLTVTKNPKSFTASKFHQSNLSSIIEQHEKLGSLEDVKHDDGDETHKRSPEQQTELQKILDGANLDQSSKVVQVLKLRQICRSVNTTLQLLRANDKLLKKKVQFFQYSLFRSSTLSSSGMQQSEPLEPTVTLIERSNRSRSTKIQHSLAPSFQDSQFKHIVKPSEPNQLQSTAKTRTQRRLMKHGTVEIINDFDHGVNGPNIGSKTAKKDPDSAAHLPRNIQRSND